MVTKLEIDDMERRFNERMDSMEKLCQSNTLAIAGLAVRQDILTGNLETLTAATQGMVNVWSAGRTLQQAAKWLSGFAIIGTMVAWWTGKI